MSLQKLPTELLLNIFRQCSSISSAINLSLTCRRLYHLLRTSQKIPVLFAIAERVWGPLYDVFQLLTYNSAQPVHVKRTPVPSFALLVQVSRIGRVALWYQDLYPRMRWDGDKAHLRRELTSREAYAVRRAVYRSWLFDTAFHTPNSSRLTRMNPTLVAERCQLLRTWSTEELIEIEDMRGSIEAFVATELCPVDGEVFWRRGGDVWSKYYSGVGGCGPTTSSVYGIFHDSRNDVGQEHSKHMPATQLRQHSMDGWGDDIEQYHNLNAMLKLNPAQIMWLYENAVTKQDVEHFVENAVGGQWFWNNGETMLSTWMLVLHRRGVPVEELKEKVYCGLAGIALENKDN